MFAKTMKPETIARRAAERKAAEIERVKSLGERLQAKALANPDSVFVDLYANWLQSNNQ